MKLKIKKPLFTKKSKTAKPPKATRTKAAAQRPASVSQSVYDQALACRAAWENAVVGSKSIKEALDKLEALGFKRSLGWYTLYAKTGAISSITKAKNSAIDAAR